MGDLKAARDPDAISHHHHSAKGGRLASLLSLDDVQVGVVSNS